MFSRFLEAYLASAFNAGRTNGISAASYHAVLIEATRARVGDMVMRTGTWDNQLRGHHGGIRSKARPGGPGRVVPSGSNLERLGEPNATDHDPGGHGDGRTAEPLIAGRQCRRQQRQREQHAGRGQPERSVEAGGDLGGLRHDDAGRHGRLYPVRGRVGLLDQRGPELAADAGRADHRAQPGDARRPGLTRLVRPRHVRPDASIPQRDRLPAWGSTTAATSTSCRNPPVPATAAAPWRCRSTTSPGPSRPRSRSTQRADAQPLRLRRQRPEGHLPVGRLGRPGARAHDDGGRQPVRPSRPT